jgi:hypothetical protein
VVKRRIWVIIFLFGLVTAQLAAGLYVLNHQPRPKGSLPRNETSGGEATKPDADLNEALPPKPAEGATADQPQGVLRAGSSGGALMPRAPKRSVLQGAPQIDRGAPGGDRVGLGTPESDAAPARRKRLADREQDDRERHQPTPDHPRSQGVERATEPSPADADDDSTQHGEDTPSCPDRALTCRQGGTDREQDALERHQPSPDHRQSQGVERATEPSPADADDDSTQHGEDTPSCPDARGNQPQASLLDGAIQCVWDHAGLHARDHPALRPPQAKRWHFDL